MVGKKAFPAIDLTNQTSLTVCLVWPPAYLIVCCLYCLECAMQKNPIIQALNRTLDEKQEGFTCLVW